MTRTELRTRAESVLRSNDRGGYTVPAPKLYPHQWNWDSAFCAIGWMHVDPRRAARELEMLLRGQWDDGLIPHIVFNPSAEHYEPGPKAWKTAGANGAPAAARATSITQPPVAATAARKVLERSGGDREVEAVLKRVVAALERWHAWFLTTRDPRGEGLPCIVHPWESGMDNAPRWDAAMKRIEPGVIEYKRVDNTLVDPSERPTRYDYDRYFFIVNERARFGFAPPRIETEPLVVQDVALAAILCRADEDLAHIASALGVSADGARARHERVAKSLNEKLLDRDGARYLDYDLRADERIRVDHVAGLLPLFAGIVPDHIAKSMAHKLNDPEWFGAPWPVPTVPSRDDHFEPKRYWRGPTWINVNWMLIDGLRRSNEGPLADRLAARTLELIEREGMREYFNPMTGEGLGADDFAWTAALAIDLLSARE